MYAAKIVADSIAENGCRLTTFEVTMPRIILSEWNTHRMFSRNTASSRAIPVKKMIDAIKDNPFIPERFPKNQAGMSNDEWLEGQEEQNALASWLAARDAALTIANQLTDLNVHKQISNRLLEPFMWTTSVTSATDWKNFFSLRCSPMAQPEIQKIAYMMRDLYEESVPRDFTNLNGDWNWHLPYVSSETQEQVLEQMSDIGFESTSALNAELLQRLIKVSIGRCARVSYLNHGENNTPEKDIEICERLIASRHMSPTEHVATPTSLANYSGNFKGWQQFRKHIDGESGE